MLLKPKAGLRLPLMHYLKVCRVRLQGYRLIRTTWKDRSNGRSKVAQVTGTQPSGGLRGPQSFLCNLWAVSYMGADAYALT